MSTQPAPGSSPLIERYVAYLQSPAFDPHLRRLAGLPLGRMLIGFVAFMTTIGIPVAIYQLVKILGHRKAYRRHLIEVARRSVPIRAYTLMTNSAIGSVPGLVAPGLAIGSFDPAVGEDDAFMGDLAIRVLTQDPDAGLSPSDADFCAQLMADEAYQPHRRRRLPASLTGGKEVYAFDLMIPSDFLREGRIADAYIPCAAEPGPAGEIHVIPAAILES